MTDFIQLDRHDIKHAWVAVGTFDGVHRGHQTLIQQLVTQAHAEHSPAVVVTFHPHPAVYFGRASLGHNLTEPGEREALLKELGVDEVFTLPFDAQLANLTALNFMQMLKDQLDVSHLLIGFNFALGRDRAGDLDTLQQLGKIIGYEVEVIPPIKMGEATISSSQIRSLLQEGLIREANEMLGRPYFLSGKVIHGEHRGNQLGFPTANLDLPRERLLPARGVYACRAFVNGSAYVAVTNIGVRPTFENPLEYPRVEPHLLDLDRDLYGDFLKLDLLEYLRPEKAFASSADLIAQVNRDIEKTRELFNHAR
jgi:riboflavin kinase/FMN adenylyltransferase